MSLKHTVVLVWVICLSYKIVLTGCEVVWVNRNVVDSFHVGKDGCTYYSSVCTNSDATCRKSDGLCLCGILKPNYINPTTRTGDNKGHGCVASYSIHAGLAGGSKNCALGPFQLIPYKNNEPARKFFDKDNPTVVMKSCSLRKVLVKFPDKATEMELPWLDKSYVDLNVSNNDMYFKWKKSVPNLQGTIITFNLHCELKISGVKAYHSYQTKCLRAKVFGKWSAGTNPTWSTPVVTKAPMTSELNQIGTMTMSQPTTSARSSSPDEGSSSDGDSSGTITIIAVVVAAVLLVILVVVVWLLCKRKKRNGPRKSSRGRSWKEAGLTNMKQSSYAESNSRGPDAYKDARDTNETFAPCSHPVYTKSDNQRFTAQEANDPAYATPNIQCVVVEANDLDGYATPDSQRVMVKANEPAYATPKSQCVAIVVEVNPAYTTPESQRMVAESNDPASTTPNDDLHANAMPDSQRVTIEANDPATCTTPDSQRVVVEANPAYETPDSQSVVCRS